MTESTPSRSSRPIAAFAAFGLFTLLLILLVGQYQQAFYPEPETLPPPPYDDYDSAAMQQAMVPDEVESTLTDLIKTGNRYPGQPGYEKTLDLVKERYIAAGLDVFEQQFMMPVPVTQKRDILDTDGAELPSVEVFPFFPNHFQPQNTPEDGLTGELVLLTDKILAESSDLSHTIGIIDLSQPPTVQGTRFLEYARMGIRALIVTHPEGLDAISWNQLPGMSTSLPIQYIRLAATPSILEHRGESVTLHVRTRYENTNMRNMIGVLRSDAPKARALILHASTDAVSYLPDQAAGVLRAIPLAVQLQTLEGLVPHRDRLKRDVIFAATSGGIMDEAGQTRLLEIIGPAGRPEAVTEDLEAAAEENESRRTTLEAMHELTALPELFADREESMAQLEALPVASRDMLDEQISYILNTRVFTLTEARTQAKINELKQESLLNYYLKEQPDDPRLNEVRSAYQQASETYREIKSFYDKAYSQSGMSIELLMNDYATEVAEMDLGRLFKNRISELISFHTRRKTALETDLALHRAILPYKDLIWLQSTPVPRKNSTESSEQVSFTTEAADLYSTHGSVLMEILDQLRQSVAFPEEFKLPPLRGNAGQNAFTSNAIENHWPRGLTQWRRFSHPAFMLIHTDRVTSYEDMNHPGVLPWMMEMDSARNLLQLTGETVLSLAFGNGDFPKPIKVDMRTYGGQVLVANMGQSIIPSYALPNSLIGNRDEGFGRVYNGYPWLRSPMKMTDPYGRFSWPHSPANMAVPGQNGYSPNAAYIDNSGVITFIKDEGGTSQRIYKSVGLSVAGNEGEDVSIVLFRGAAVTALDMINPQTMENFAGIDYITQEGLTPFDKHCRFVAPKDQGLMTYFIDPTRRFYVRLRSGAAGNPDALAVRAFMLRTTAPFPQSVNREIEGAGYWPTDHHLLLDIPFETADSMLFLNGKRLDLQTHYNMADEQTRRFQEVSETLLEKSRDEDLPYAEKVNRARDATTYAILNHPILRESISEAVIGILWYLGLLVPFCFFFEKLVFGFSDIRKQIGAQAVIFLVVFFLLRLLHPAFEMIRSSIMILLGFIILLISTGITALFMGKFQENLDSLRKQQGRVKAAEVNTAGAVGMAFMLGLNNMHRRKVRTGLTCATLVLMTFVMICFTSTQSDIVQRNQAISKADYQGILFKDSELRNISEAELNALQAKFASRFALAPRTFYVGSKDYLGTTANPEVEVFYTEGDSRRAEKAQSIIELTPQEPLQNQIRIIAGKPWFEESPTGESSPREVFLSLPMAESLRIRPDQVTEENNPTVSINGTPHTVLGIFDPASLHQLTDLDGDTLLPFDVEAMADAVLEESRVLSSPGAPRFSPENVLLVRRNDQPLTVMAGSIAADRRDFSVAMVMPDLSYRDAREVIEQTMEQTGKELYYGLDGVSYVGKRSRESSVTGMLDMIIPLIIAALTVLNTMKGSVYERRDEIYVYNAVGIAPKYIFFMFIAEAFVYAVVGSVLGYILSQGTGRILTELNMTGGLNMTYTSLTTIYASLTIAASVFISTIFPARSAMEIASPAEEAGWALPEPDEDILRFNLPFTFNHRDRLAVLSFFNRYFQNHAEGSSGPFFCSEPNVGISAERDTHNGDQAVPQIQAPVWLKPFDLGVSQKLTIEMPTDEETGEFIARITLERDSGTHEAWLRLNHYFVILIRRHFLHWRAVSEEEREEMFAEAKTLFESTTSPT